MSDAELVKAAAETVLELQGPWCDCEWAPLDLGNGFCHDCEKKVMPNPLTDDTDNAAVLDKMAADGFVVHLSTTSGTWGEGWMTAFGNGPAIRFTGNGQPGEARRRCVVIASLRAKGVEVGEEAES